MREVQVSFYKRVCSKRGRNQQNISPWRELAAQMECEVKSVKLIAAQRFMALVEVLDSLNKLVSAKMFKKTDSYSHQEQHLCKNCNFMAAVHPQTSGIAVIHRAYM